MVKVNPANREEGQPRYVNENRDPNDKRSDSQRRADFEKELEGSKWAGEVAKKKAARKAADIKDVVIHD